jgi:hypothetical protein
MDSVQKLRHLVDATANWNKGYSYDFRPFLITYQIFPCEDGSYEIFADEFSSVNNSYKQVARFILTGGDINQLS